MGEGGSNALTPGSRRSRNSMHRQTFSASSSDSSWKFGGIQEAVGDLCGLVSPTPPSPPAASPVVRRWRQHPVDHQPGDVSSPATAYAGDPAADGATVATASSPHADAVGLGLGRSSPKSPTSIHGYGYRSPRFGGGDEGEGDVLGGGDGAGLAPPRLNSGAVSRCGAAGAARETTGWTRPVLEGGSLRQAAGRIHRNAVLHFNLESRSRLQVASRHTSRASDYQRHMPRSVGWPYPLLCAGEFF